MPNLSAETRLVFSDQVVTRELAGESVLLDLRSGIFFGLNSIGTDAWTSLAAGSSLREVSEAIHASTDAPVPVVLEDLLRFADDLLAHGLCAVSTT
jgi:hypothetical protein